MFTDVYGGGDKAEWQEALQGFAGRGLVLLGCLVAKSAELWAARGHRGWQASSYRAWQDGLSIHRTLRSPKKEETLTHATAWMNLEDIMLSETSH